MEEGRVRARAITFKDEHGREWELRAFCRHHGAVESTIRNKYYRMGRPEQVDSKTLLTKGERYKLQSNMVPVTVLLPGNKRKNFAMVIEMCVWARDLAEQSGGKYEPVLVQSYYTRWKRLGKPPVLKLKEIMVAPPAGNNVKRNEHLVVEGLEGDLERLGNEVTARQRTKLSIIPGPSRFEEMYFSDAGKFGAGEVSRSNFAGRTKGGGPIYTGR